MAAFHGVGINFGVGSTIIGVNGLFQTRDHDYSADSILIKDGGDTTISKAYFDYREEATFTYVAFQPVSLSGDAIVDKPTVGQFITVVDTYYAPISGVWLVDHVRVSSSNTSAARVTLTVSRYPYLQII